MNVQIGRAAEPAHGGVGRAGGGEAGKRAGAFSADLGGPGSGARAGAGSADLAGVGSADLAAYLASFAEPSGYLDFARYGPISTEVAATLTDAAAAIRTGGWDALAELDALTEDARRTAAALLAAAPREIAFVSSTSHGMAAAAFAFRGPGTVVMSRSDFPAAVYPWLRAAERDGLAVRFADGPLTADTLRPLLDDSVRAVSVCAADAGTGFVAPLADLKDLIGPERALVVDAVQAFGAVPIEAGAADVVASGGQKWLRSGWGAAVLMIRDRVADRTGPGIGGWSGVQDPLVDHDHPHSALSGAAAHTFTNPDGPAVAALGAGMRLAHEAGVGRVNELILDRLGALLEAARGAGAEIEDGAATGATRSGIARFRLPGADPERVHRHLLDAGLTTTLRGEWIRVSPHASTDPACAGRLGAALRRARRL